ncbi:MAG TPA: glycosyltransferase family 39 protein [Gaiellaceae bacterium]|nr:glycosyltransferase family 39 protein [Gaiellaceae bacterium]
MRSRLAAAPARVWVGAIVVCSFAVRFAFARHMVGPWIMIDEIVYSELAKSFAATGHFAVREVPTTGYGFVYPILISPAYALFRSIPTVYTGIKVINSLLMSLAAVPAYLLARRVVSQRGALVVAVLTVAVPSMFYAGTVMTENAFYPIFLLLVLALVAALDAPSLPRVALFLASLVLAYETRAQAVAVLAAALTAPLVAAALARRPRETLAHRWLYGLVLGAAAIAIAAEVVRGHSVRSLLGAYASATHSGYGIGGVAHWLLWHLAELDLYVGVVPVLALLLLCTRGAALAPAERTVVAATASVVAWTALEVAAFASQPSVLRIEERNLFYVAPLLYTCLVLWVERGLPTPRAAATVAAVATVVLAAAVPYERFFTTSSTSDTFGVLMLWSVALWFGIHAQDMRWVVGAAALVFVVAALVVPRRYGLALAAVPLAISLLAIQPVDSRTQRASIGAVFQGVARPDRDWITGIVGSRDPQLVSVVWTGATDRLTVNENEFFNRDVGTVYTTNGPVPGGLAQTPIALDRRSGTFRAGGRDVHVRDLLADTTIPFAGARLGADPIRGLVLLRVDGPLRVAYETSGIYGDSWSGRTATYRQIDCNGGILSATLGSDKRLYRTPQRVVATENGRTIASASVPPSRLVTMHVPLRGTCLVRFTVARTRVPGHGDTRRLGVRFVAFSVS